MLRYRLASCSSQSFGVHNAAMQVVKNTEHAQSVLLQLPCRPGLQQTQIFGLRRIMDSNGGHANLAM